MVIGLEGEVINLRESTAQMSVKRLASLIEYVQAWAVENDVILSDGWRHLDERRNSLSSSSFCGCIL